MTSTTQSIIAITIIWICAVLIRRSRTHKTPPLPPAPPADPILGHLRFIPKEDIHLFFHKLATEYGDVVSLRIPGKTIILLNSAEVAVDLLEKRGANYSSRLTSCTLDMMGWHKNLTLMQYGDEFRKIRRLVNEYMARTRCIPYQPIQEREARKMVKNLLSSPSDFTSHLSTFSAAVILSIVHGHEVLSNDDPYLKIANDVNYMMSVVALPSTNTVDLFPILKHFPAWFPGTAPATEALSFRTVVEKMHRYPFEDVKKQLSEGTAVDSFLSVNMKKLNELGDKAPYTSQDIEGTAAVLYVAGADTTWSSLFTFIFAMVLHPDVQKKAQREIDDILGENRTPSFEDRQNLKYVECVIQEVYRWYNVIPAGIPHRSMEDDIYRGMFIPKGSVVVPNTRAITRDERIYKNSDLFDPSRYLRGEPYPDAHFGYGRRKCPGRHLADATVWIGIASILAEFTISPALDGNGIPILPPEEFKTGISSHPKYFKCSIVPRGRE